MRSITLQTQSEGVKLSDRNEIVNEWLSRLNELQPADGKLTSEIKEAVGPFPVYRPPGDAYDYRDDDEKSYQYHNGTVARVYALEMAKFRIQQAKNDINAQYWSQILTWLKTIQ
jgi:hypothetical protein